MDDLSEKIKKLPLMDVSVSRILNLLGRPDSNFEQIAANISPEVAVTFLNIAGSAYYGRNIRSIEHAVRLLGFQRIKEILMVSLMMEQLIRRADIDRFNVEKYQRHAAFCVMVSRALSKIVGYERSDDLATAAMLHNIGKMVIAVFFPTEKARISALVRDKGASSSDAEFAVLGRNHAQIGADVLEMFQVSRELSEAVRHHENSRPPDRTGAGSHLQLMLGAASRIADSFTLPEPGEETLTEQALEKTVAAGARHRKEILRQQMRTRGYATVFQDLIEQAAADVTGALSACLAFRKTAPSQGSVSGSPDGGTPA